MSVTANDKITSLYIGSALAIVLVLVLVIQLFKQDRKLKRDSDKRYSILVDTPKGLVKVDNSALAIELERIKKLLTVNIAGATDRCADLTPMLNTSIRNLAEFIQENPTMNEEALCGLELRAELINSYMVDSIKPDERDYATSYKSITDWEEYERDMPANANERLKFLIGNLDVAIQLLRNDVCNNGRLSLTRLYDLLLRMNEQICIDGSMSDPNIQYGNPPFNRYDRPPRLPDLVKSSHTVEPFESREVVPRHRPEKNDFGKMKIIPANVRKPTFSYLQSTDRLWPTDIAGNADYTAPKEVEVGDRSFEGSVERDILGYKPPGHMISQLYDASEHYTVRVGSCGGKTVSDAALVKECVDPSLSYFKALTGDGSEMLDCVGDCNGDQNSNRWYNKVRNSTGLDIRYNAVDFV